MHDNDADALERLIDAQCLAADLSFPRPRKPSAKPRPKPRADDAVRLAKAHRAARAKQRCLDRASRRPSRAAAAEPCASLPPAEATLRLQCAHRRLAARRCSRAAAATHAARALAFLLRHPLWTLAPRLSPLAAAPLAAGRRLGATRAAVVYQPHGARLAVKAVALRGEAAAHAAQEAHLLARAQRLGGHKHLIRLHGTFIAGGHARLALELAAGDLHAWMRRARGGVARREALAHARALGAGLGHLHGAEICHRDVKLSNALLMEDGTLKLADLGFGLHASQLRDGRATGACGTPATMAPEVLSRGSYCPFTADAWSFGICVLTLLAPRDFDEHDDRRVAFYPFSQPDDSCDDYAAFVAPLAAPPGLAAGGEGPTARLLRRRALLGEAAPQLPRRLVQLIDGLLAPAPRRLLVADAAPALEAE